MDALVSHTPQPDFLLTEFFGVPLLYPMTRDARFWIEDHLDTRTIDGGYIIPRHEIPELLQSLLADYEFQVQFKSRAVN